MQTTDGGRPPRGRFCFVHASDLHLDAVARGIPGAPEPIRTAMRDASLQAWQALVQLAVTRQAAFFIIAGGLFDSAAPSLRARVALRDGLERLRDNGVQAFVALGADDAAALPLATWITAGATVFAEGEGLAVPVWRGGLHLATVRGASCVQREPERLLSEPWDGQSLTVGVLPAPLGLAARDPAASPSTALLLRHARVSYWALGGLHERAIAREQPWVACPGTPQGRALEAAELGAKGCLLVEVEDGRISEVAVAALDRVRFLSLRLELAGGEDAVTIRQRLLRELDRETASDPRRVVIVEAHLDGDAGSALGADRPAAGAAVLDELRRACDHAAPLVWWARVQDHTVHLTERMIDGDDLRCVLVAQGDALGAPLPRSTYLARQFEPLLRIWDGEIELSAQRELVRDAARLALTSLEREGRR